ncbi:hypothetical protein HPB52_012694 [Rhipicephalus sanguineus]|uniref:Uncharacterized protein n=1 Tax=Rhipicephalus sanguineus TaxID=34632 RepID=A0A9D4PGS3_RHISA|nr:hypothetical protein HPB52_012694 [Rhipicephalus sanguineus]
MELIGDFGDPDDLTLAEDHIILKLETALPPEAKLPEGLAFGDVDGLLLIANQRSLVSAMGSALLREARVSKALFCGCAPFDSCELFANVASELLRDAQEVHIVHNRNMVYKLIRMFPSAKVIALPHDLSRHYPEFDEPRSDLTGPLVERSQLRQLVGSSGEQRTECLSLSHETTLELIRNCPYVCRINSRWVVSCFTKPHSLLTSADRCKAKNFTHVNLIDQDLVLTTRGLGMSAATADIAVAATTFPSVETLEVCLGSQEALGKISAFRNLRNLAVAFTAGFIVRDMSTELEQLLAKLPGLEALELENCGGIRLPAISRLCTRLKILRLVNCVGSLSDVPVDADAFADLECLELDMQILKAVFNSLLDATKNKLRNAHFRDEALCLAFLQHCVESGRRLPFLNLERLTLNTKESLSALGLQPEDLHDVLHALPALRCVETNSYDLRLFFENSFPRGRVSLSWIGCVYCAVHRPAY